MDRVDGMLALHRQLHGQPGRPRQTVSDLLRGSLVLAVGALDGLVLEAVVEVVPHAARAGSLGPTAAKWVKDDPDALLAAVAASNPFEAIGAHAKDQLGGVTFQRAKAIEGVLRDVVGCAAPWPTAAKQLTGPRERWSEQRVQSRLDEFVSRRHRIAHSGDMAVGRHTTSPITLLYATEAARLTRAVGLAVCTTADARIRALRSPR